MNGILSKIWILSSLIYLSLIGFWVSRLIPSGTKTKPLRVNAWDALELIEQASYLHAHEWSRFGMSSNDGFLNRAVLIPLGHQMQLVMIDCKSTKNPLSFECSAFLYENPDTAFSFYYQFEKLGSKNHWAFRRSTPVIQKQQVKENYSWCMGAVQELLKAQDSPIFTELASKVIHEKSEKPWQLVVKCAALLQLMDRLSQESVIPLVRSLVEHKLLTQLKVQDLDLMKFSPDAVEIELYSLDPNTDLPKLKIEIKKSYSSLFEGLLSEMSESKIEKGILSQLIGAYEQILSRSPILQSSEQLKKIQVDLGLAGQSSEKSQMLLKESPFFESLTTGIENRILASISFQSQFLLVDEKGIVFRWAPAQSLQRLSEIDLSGVKRPLDLVSFQDPILGFENLALNLHSKILITEDGIRWQSFEKPEHLQGEHSRILKNQTGSGVFLGRDKNLYFTEDFKSYAPYSTLPLALSSSYWFTHDQGYFQISHCEGKECRSISHHSKDAKTWEELGKCNLNLFSESSALTYQNQLIYLDVASNNKKATVYRSLNGMDFIAYASNNLKNRKFMTASTHQDSLFFFSGLDSNGLVTTEVQIENQSVLQPLATNLNRLMSLMDG